MAKLIIEVPTMEQAKQLARWYECQGEEDAGVWFECQDMETPISDSRRKGGCIIEDKDNETVTLYCK